MNDNPYRDLNIVDALRDIADDIESGRLETEMCIVVLDRQQFDLDNDID